MNNETKNKIEKKYGACKKYLRAKEAAEYMGVSLSTIWLYAKQGKLTPKKISSRVTVFSIEDINKFVESGFIED